MKDNAIILNSPVEFAIVGPAGGRDRVLVRSENVGLDLIGLVAQGPEARKDSSADDVLSLLIGDARQLNFVTSYPSRDINPELDSRRSVYSFAWKGYASKLGVEKIERVLNLHLPDIERAIKEGDFREIQWAIGPLIYHSTQENERRLRRRRLLFAAGVLYIGIGILALALSVASRLSLPK